MRYQLGIACAVVLAAGLTISSAARATFVQETSLGEPGSDGNKYFLVGSKNSTAISGDVGSQSSGVIVNGLANVAVDAANGWSNIKATTNNSTAFTSITFTPVDPTRFGDFDLRGQMYTTDNLTISVTDNTGKTQTFTYTISNANQDISRIGIASFDGETIKSVTVADKGGFKELKQIEFSPCNSTQGGTCSPVQPPPTNTPEPASLLLLGTGLVSAGWLRSRRKGRA